MSRRVLVTGGSGFIGTNAVRHLTARGDTVLNLDRSPPRDPAADRSAWTEVDLLDAPALAEAVADFDPSLVVHLAARTDLEGQTVADYAVNVEGTANLFAALAGRSCEKVLVASTMLVCPLGHRPTGPDDYGPTTAYGESKRDMERLVRSLPAAGTPPWVLARLTSIWGPWFGEPYRPFFERVLAGRFAHPGSTPVVKAFGYVGNVLHQVERLLADDRLDRGTVYLTDYPSYSTHEFADAIADQAGTRRPRNVPVAALRLAAWGGDALKRTGVVHRPPMTSFRLANMLQPGSFDTAELEALTGPLPYDLAAGVAETLAWLASPEATTASR